MDKNIMLWTVLVIVFIIGYSSSQRNNQLASVIRAMCQARCYDTYGVQSDGRDDANFVDFKQKTCTKKVCRKCLDTCDITYTTDSECKTYCNSSTSCLQSCSFLKDIRSNFTEDDDAQQPSTSANLIRQPEVVCISVPYDGHKCNRKVASVYLKWDVVEHILTETLVFVISVMKKERENSTTGRWHVIQIVPYSFVQVDKLACDKWYKFRVAVVTATGVKGQMLETNWSHTPGVGYQPGPPLSIKLEQQTLLDQHPSVTISWDPGEDASCYFKIFWMSSSSNNIRYKEEEIKPPHEFRYRIKHLEFSTNYDVNLYSYDDTFRHSSSEVKLSFVTPNCLESTMYNYTVCAPLAPLNLTLEVLTHNHEDEYLQYVNVTLRWIPPPNTHNGNDILRYYLEYRKEPPINAAHRIEPHSDSKIINPSETEITLDNIHNHNMYHFSLTAESDGGRGDSAKLSHFVDDPRNNSTHSGRNITSNSGLRGPISKPDKIYDETDSTALHTGRLSTLELVAIIIVPVILIMALIIVIRIVVLRRRRAYKPYPSSTRSGPVEELNPIYEGIPRGPLEATRYAKPDDYELDYACLDFISVIGEGAFGKVVKAEYYQSQNDRDKNDGKIVAVKMLKDFYTGDESRSFMLEIQSMKNLGHHPFIVSIIGSCLSGPKLCLVMDYCALGDLRNYLRKYREKLMCNMPSTYTLMPDIADYRQTSQLLQTTNGVGQILNTNCTVSHTSLASDTIGLDGNSEISEGQLLSYGRQITIGMEFLEQRKFIHRDLAARNILLFDHRHIKISDFGLTRDVYETNVYQPTSGRKLPYKWMAIESLFNQRFTIKSDVWSFGIVLWEIVTLGGSPYPSIPLKDLYGLLNDGYRMEKPENCNAQLYKIMLSCWHPNPNHRPSFTQLKREIEALLEETQLYIDLSIEVSEDYFNESNGGSQCPEYHASSTSLRTDKENLIAPQTNEFIDAKNVCVDIHSEPKEFDTDTESPIHENEEEVKLLQGDHSDNLKTCSPESSLYNLADCYNKTNTEFVTERCYDDNTDTTCLSTNIKNTYVPNIGNPYKSNVIESCPSSVESNNLNSCESNIRNNVQYNKRGSVHSENSSRGLIASRPNPTLIDGLRSIVIKNIGMPLPLSQKSTRISISLNDVNDTNHVNSVSVL